MTQKTVYQIDGSKQKDIVNGLRKAGFRLASMNSPIPTEEVRDILGTLSASIRRKLSTGDAEFIPRERAEFTNGEDSVAVNDFDIQDRQRVQTDPVVIVLEKVPNTTSLIVREILEETVTIDIIRYALVSVTGTKFKTSVKDLARITNENPNIVYNRCINTLVKSCVAGFKRIDVTEYDLLPRARKKIQVEAA